MSLVNPTSSPGSPDSDENAAPSQRLATVYLQIVSEDNLNQKKYESRDHSRQYYFFR